MESTNQLKASAEPEGIPSISVIVPVYNVERYLSACMESILSQTFSNIEVIAVDDGSTDSSPAILARFASEDGRVRVITRSNSGYGSAVNVGIDEALAPYISIVEPDDFIGPTMFEDLIAVTTYGGNKPADIVKSSYWNYYDYEDGTDPFIRPSNLMLKMPSELRRFTVREDCEILFHHPSIWSAIYRKDFLCSKGIRMIEVPGAGWVDNPFMYETLLQADSIVWSPSAHYRYRQTNANASCYLKDFHIPFDRLRDIRGIYNRLSINDPQLLCCLYHRSFSYIKSVLEKFHFPESDPEVFSSIVEVLKSMDERVLHSGKRGIRKDHIDYYELALGKYAERIVSHGKDLNPKLCIVIPLLNDRPFIADFLESVCGQRSESIEVICVDCGSTDRTNSIVESFATKDARITLMVHDGKPIAKATLQAVQGSKAPYAMVADPSRLLPKDFVHTACQCLELHPEVELALFDVDGQLALDSTGIVKSSGILAFSDDRITNKVFRRSLLHSVQKYFEKDISRSFPVTSFLCLTEVEYVAVVDMHTTKVNYRRVESPLAFVEIETAYEETGIEDVLWVSRHVAGEGSGKRSEMLKSLIGRTVEHDIHLLKTVDDARRYLRALRDIIDSSPMLDDCATCVPNARSYLKARSFASMSDLEFMAFLLNERILKESALAQRLQHIERSRVYEVGRKANRLLSKISDVSRVSTRK